MQSDDLFINWKGGIFEGLLFRPSLFNSTNLYAKLNYENFIKFGGHIYRDIAVSMTNINKGMFRTIKN